MIRVLHSVSNMDRAGIETMLMNYYRNIDRSKIQFDFLCNKSKPGAYDDEIKSMGGRIFHSPGLNPLKFLKYQRYMKKLFEDNPDIKIDHSHNGEFAYQSLLGAYRSHIKTRICHAHNTKIESNYKKILKLIYKPKLKKVANYYWGCGTDAIRFYFGKDIVDNKNYFVLHNAIDVEKFKFNQETRDRIRRQLNIEDKFVIGNIGRFMEQKNHTFTLDLFKRIVEKNDNTVLLLIGDGELQEKIQKKALDLGIADKILFLGNINNVNEIYQAMDVFILPSLFEGLPVVGIEAQTAGLKCFFSNNITKEVALTDNVKFIDLNHDIDEWANEILNVQGYSRKDMSKIIAKQGYSIKVEAKKLQKIYMEFAKNYEEA